MSRRTQVFTRSASYFVYETFTLSGLPSQVILLYPASHVVNPITPTYGRFGLFPFRSPLLGESISLSFPLAT